ncbi:MAG: hypothetical protein CVV64_19580 [Candidatus Wallbacteria bacterium HGW-Wallbacteria-1]|jgi:hypothetical protein|uniref:Nitrile hydratase alpha/Thiocyanate hydrolase gamma domain-containing protein n=1 Tax=Candidatus Wallbacteria bacterium HGW-Wallbacteria-1 TaxID=2013854 RepID=A0A2N1PIU8_9BACT|nr:MAG: hypothetical protein CVV64_19580 [Candidatus Wallbacteria bacterium HGW-Wallbacteria-1]
MNITELFTILQTDPDYRAAFIADPAWVLKKADIDIAGDRSVIVHENDHFNHHYVLHSAFVKVEHSEIKPTDMAMAIQVRADKDPEFRKILLEDPELAIRKALNVSIPPKMKMHIHENTPHTFHIVLPQMASENELSDRDLELVAGGKGDTTIYEDDNVEIVYHPPELQIDLDPNGDLERIFSGW